MIEINFGALLSRRYRFEAEVNWEQKIFDIWDYYGPGTANEKIDGYCEIIVK